MEYRKRISISEFKNQFNNTNDDIKCIKRIFHNVFEYVHNGIKKVRYCETDIIIYNKNSITLNTSGFYTTYTKKYINELLAEFYYKKPTCKNIPYIYQEKHIWYYQNKYDEVIRFFDMMKIDNNTSRVINTSSAPRYKGLDNKNKRIMKLIKAYCDKVNNMKKLPDNADGDCFFCKSLFIEDKEHLILHLKEKYVMKTLIFKALHENLYRAHIIYLLESEKKGERHFIIRALKKYFTNHLIKQG